MIKHLTILAIIFIVAAHTFFVSKPERRIVYTAPMIVVSKDRVEPTECFVNGYFRCHTAIVNPDD